MSLHAADRLSEYIDGELTPGEKTRVDGHLGSCSDCRARLEDLRALARSLKDLPRAAPPPRLVARLRAAAAGTAAAPSPWQPNLRAAAYALTAVMTVMAANELLPRRRAPARDGEPSRSALGAQMRAEGAGGSGPEAPAAVRPASADRSREETAKIELKRAPGAPYGQAAPKPAEPATNEELYRHLIQEKKRMGIAKALPREPGPSPEEKRQHEWARRAKASGQLILTRAAGASSIDGATPVLLAEEGSAELAPGRELDRTSSIQYSARREGAVVKAQADLLTLWALLGSRQPIPNVDFSREMVVAVLPASGRAPAQIEGIDAVDGRLRVSFRDSPAGGKAGAGVSYRVVPISDLPVEFLKLD